MTITKDMIIGDILKEHYDLVKVFIKYNIQCIGCSLARFETVEQGAHAHGIDVDEFIEELNKKLDEINNDAV